MQRSLFSSLRFDDPRVEASFRAHDCLATVPVARYCYFTGCFLWAGFGVVDVLLAPERLGALWAIRFGIGLPTLVLAALATFVEPLQRRLKLVGVAVTLLCGGSIIAMTAVLDSPVAGSYYVGLILVLFCSYIFAQLRFYQAVFSSLALLVSYELVLVLEQSAPADIVVNNSAFVISTIYIGSFACFKLEQHRRNEYTYTRTIEDQSTRDALTGLLNRRQLVSTFDAAVRRAAELVQPTAILLIDVDDFKLVNDRWGHGVGDEALAAVALAVRTAAGEPAAAFRIGGDEFLLVLPETSAVASVGPARHIVEATRTWSRAAAGSRGPRLSVSIGITEVVSGRDSLRAVLRTADAALYAAKRHGKGRVVVRPRPADADRPRAAASWRRRRPRAAERHEPLTSS